MEKDYKPCRFLASDEVELRVANIAKNNNKCTLLIYKTARIDMEMLDYMFGTGNWQDDYKEIKGVMYCGIGVNFSDGWVWKWNAGVESKGMDDDNNKKGEASDAFKRAGFLWGIGRELYKWKEINIALNDDDFWIFNQGTQNEKRKLKTNFTVVKLEYNEDGTPKELVITDDNLGERYRYSKPAIIKNDNNETVKQVEPEKPSNVKPQKQYGQVMDLIKGTAITLNDVANWINIKFKSDVRINDLKPAEFDQLMTALNAKINPNAEVQS
ncbi:MAG: hypothetical protein EOM29_09525 [Bacteroidia bacterium]|nr:hypothetical protein [Bacteroidia bacterium]